MSSKEESSQVLDDPYVMPKFKQCLVKYHDLVAYHIQSIKDVDSNKKPADFEPMNYDQFYDAVQNIFKEELKAECIKTIFKKININMDAPIDWTELFGYFPSEGTSIMKGLPIFMISRRQQVEQREEERRRHDHIQCIVNVPQLDQVIAATQKGIIFLYNNQDISQVTGCDYLSQFKRIVTVTETSIVIWDHKPKSKNQTNFFTLKPMKNIILCICTVTLSEYMNEDCMLIGDDAGFVNLIIVGSEDLNLQKSMESNVLQSQVLDPRLLRRPILRRKLHNDWVLKVKYFAHLNYFACCSSDSVHSVVLDDIRKLGDCQPIRTLSVPRGVNAFDYCVRTNTIVTGGEDKVIRLWNPHMFSRPKSMLFGHNCIITDIVINEADQHIISLSTEGMFRVWDIQTLAVLQVFTMGEHNVDRHFNTMVFDSKNKRLITGSTMIDLVPLMSAVHDTMQVPLSHERSINVLVYNRTYKQLVSICSKPIIKMWELETGKKVYQVTCPHGHAIEVTAAAVDPSGTYLITGAADGSLVTWEFYTGEKMKSLPPVSAGSEEDQRIFQLFFLTFTLPRLILALGWHDKIKIIQDGPDESNLLVLGVFPDITMAVYNRSGIFLRKQSQISNGPSNHGKEDDLTSTGVGCIDVISINDESLLAVGWYSVIMVWNVETATIMQIFNEDQISDSTAGDREEDFMQDMESSKVHVVKFLALKSEKNDVEIFGPNDEFPIPSSTNVLTKLSKLSLMFKYTDSYAPSEFSQTEFEITPVPLAVAKSISTPLPIMEPNPIVLSAHQDGSIQFWSLEGVQLEKILPTFQFSSPITTVHVDDNATRLIAGNQRGYIIIWDIGAFMDDPYVQNKEAVNRIISWRAHNLQIVSLFYVESSSVVVSASIDCSVRVWYAPNGYYIGYFGQHSTLILMEPSKFVLPNDITEAPVETKSKESDKSDHQLDYPLMLDWERWKPFDREAYEIKLKQQRKVLDMDQDKKFFRSVTVPRLKAKPVENSISGSRATGAVFRALPVYNIDPLFRINPFEGISVSPGEGSHDSLHDFFAGERKGITSNIKKDAKGVTLNTIQTCHVFNASPTPPAYVVML